MVQYTKRITTIEYINKVCDQLLAEQEQLEKDPIKNKRRLTEIQVSFSQIGHYIGEE